MIGDGVDIRSGWGANAVEPRVFAHGVTGGRHGDEDGYLEHLDADFVGAGRRWWGRLDIGDWGIYSRSAGEATAIDKFMETVGKGFRCKRSRRRGCFRCIGKYGNSVVCNSTCSWTLAVTIFTFDKDGLGTERLFMGEMGNNEEGGKDKP